MNKKKKSLVLLLICFIFLCLGPVVFAGGEADIIGETKVKAGQVYEYSLSHLNEQEGDIYWYIQDNIQGVSIENLDQNRKAKIYIADNITVESFELIVKMTSPQTVANDTQDTITNDMQSMETGVEEKIISKVIQVEKENNQILKETKSGNGIIITDTFKDAKFAEYMKNYYDLDTDGMLSQEEINKVTLLNLSDSQIKSLEGIECLNNLTALTLTSVQVNSLDISMFNQLMSLTCNNVPLTNLVIRNNTIEVLKVNNSQLTTIDFSHSYKLRSINCSQNTNLSVLTFSNQNAITSLTCKETAITSLDLSALSLLTEIDCGNNALTSLDLSNHPLLQYVTVSNCQTLKSINVTKCPELLKLYAGTNALTELNVTQNTKLTVLNVPNNAIESIDLTNNVELEDLDIMQNRLSILDVSHNTKLTQYKSLGKHQIYLQFQYDQNHQKWISQPVSFLDNKTFSGSMFTSINHPVTYDETTKCFVVDKASQMSTGSMTSTFTLPGNGTTAKLNATLYFDFICHVQYETVGGTPQPENKQVSFGSLLQEPVQPTKIGYLFKGWYKDEGREQPWDFQNDKIDSDLTLYAKWDVQKLTVRFHNPYDTSLPSQTIEYQDTIKEPTAKSVKNHQFIGWYTDKTYQNRWDFINDHVTSDIDLYAYYQEVVEKPQSSLLSHTQVNQGSQVVLTSDTINAKIYYTIDGTKPTAQSHLYTKPIIINDNMTISAIAVKEGCIDSEIAIYHYTVMKEGNVDVIIKVEGAGNVSVGAHQDILDAVLNDKDYEEYKKGNDIIITLECQLIEGKTENIDKNIVKGYQIGKYLDISIFKQIGNKDKEKVTELNHPIQITIDVPNELLPANGVKRVYSVLRIHNSENTLLTDQDQELKTITIESHKFSTYVILYQDEKIIENKPQSQTAKTGDYSEVFNYGLLAIISCVGIIMTQKKKFNNDK